MEKRKTLILFFILCLGLSVLAQRKPDYQPLSQKDQTDISQTMFNRSLNNFLITQSLPIGPVNVTNILNMVSYNPIEGTRIRLSLETNNKFSKRLGFSLMGAYGTLDKEFKYSVGAAYNFARKPKGVFTYPASTLAINYSYNTFIPSYSNYDVAYFSLGTWDRFYFGKKQETTLSFLQDFKGGFSIRPFATYEKIDSYLLYDEGDIQELLLKDLENYSAGISLSFSPHQSTTDIVSLLNSRFYAFPSSVSLTYTYNYQTYLQDKYYNYIYLSAQHRFNFKPMALDFRITGGKIFGDSYDYTYFSPNYRVSDVSNMFGFNLYSNREMRFKEYVQTFTQFNLGGLLLDNITFFKQFRPNEFVNVKALFTAEYEPYLEVGLGIDHIFAFFGVEVVKRIASKNPMQMPEWGFKIRCTI